MSQQPADPSAFPPGEPVNPEPIRAPCPKKQWTLPRFRLVLHYKAELELMFVVRTVMELMRLCRAEATHKMWEAYHCGRSVLLVTYKERAELYAEQFTSRGLVVSIEPQE
jgi:ATP-dependent Clp protease adapter protein ClpS